MIKKDVQMGNAAIKSFGMTLVFLLLPLSVLSQEQSKSAYPPDIPGSHVESFKIVGEVDLRLWIFTPSKHTKQDKRPAIVFFFGGGWRTGTPKHFVKHCEYLASRGMVAMAADYRVFDRHGVKAKTCVEDAKSAVRWIRKNASRLGIDPDRIAAGGGSAGAHLAAATATLPLYDDPNDDSSISCIPNALVLFVPPLVLAPVPGLWESEIPTWVKETLGVEPVTVSPYHYVKSGLGPTIIFHGMSDKIVSYKTVEMFYKKMHEHGNRCELVGYEGADHGFFIYGNDSNAPFIDTVAKMDAFLVSIGYLSGAPASVHHK